MKLHISLNVENFDAALEFYSYLFNQKPTVQKPDYAKWDVEDPAVNFVIEPSRGAVGLSHLGIQASSQAELNAVADRMRNTEQPFLDIESTHCCYARMDKAWVQGIANEKWEAFLTHRHNENEYGEDRDNLFDHTFPAGSDNANCC